MKDTISDSLNPIFIGHGSPMNAIEVNNYTLFLSNYTKTIAIPKAIVVITAHWQTKGTFITGNDHPEQIYDFYGFPDELYNVKYNPIGSKQVAELISSEIKGISIDGSRGIDHAGWAVVKHMFPEQNVPLLEISLDINLNAKQHFLLGQQLGKLSNKGILFIGSGNMVHNLRDISFNDNEKPFQWAVDADLWLSDCLNNTKINELIEYETLLPDFRRSIPTNEHYLPLLYILGMHDQRNKIKTIYEEIQNGSISMRSIEVTP